MKPGPPAGGDGRRAGSAHSVAPDVAGRRADGGEAVHGPRRDRAPAALTLDAHRTAVGVLRGSGRVAEQVVGERQQGLEALDGRLEHMFVRVDGSSDGNQAGPVAPCAPPAGTAQEPSEDHTSSLVATRSTTAAVNSEVPAWPPRSGVLTPEATVSRVPS